MTSTPTAATSKRSPWVTAIVIGFAIMIVMNAAFIWVAVNGQDPVVPSYSTESR